MAGGLTRLISSEFPWLKEDDGTDVQGDDRPVRCDDAPREEPTRPKTATVGGEGGGDSCPGTFQFDDDDHLLIHRPRLE
ncbi:hypothetical protein GCM10009602_47900 [Nocardiopsis tropica]